MVRHRRGVEIKTLISHVMETWYRRSETGAAISRDIINLFVCTYNGTEIFRAEPASRIANPVHHLLHSGDRELEFRWTDDNGQVGTASAKITVE